MHHSNDVDPPIAVDLSDSRPFQPDPKLVATDTRFHEIKEACSDGRYVCCAEGCMDRRLTVIPSHVRDGVFVSAHFKHVASRHGAPGPRASTGESGAHLLAKTYVADMGRRFGFDVDVELHIDIRSGSWRVPDVIWRTPSGEWALEVQFSHIPAWQWKQRTDDLRSEGLKPLWLWGVRTCAPLGRVDVRGEWSQMYRRPVDVWVVEADDDAIGLASVSQCHSVGFEWERTAAWSDRKPRWPNALDYEPDSIVEFCSSNGLKCVDVNRRLNEVALKPTSPRSPRAKRQQTSVVDRRDDSVRVISAVDVKPIEIEDMDLMAFKCPRCGDAMSDRFYGPCSVCRAELDCPQCQPGRAVNVEHPCPTCRTSFVKAPA